MEKGNLQKNTRINTGKQLVLTFVALVVLVGAGVFGFLRFFSQNNEELVYAERLSQMQEVTTQLFSGLEDVVSMQWERARAQCNYLNDARPKTVDGLLALMRKQAELNEIGDGSDVIGFDSKGRYYTQDGRRGLMIDTHYLDGRPQQVSYVFNEMTTTKTQMLFLYLLDEPRTLQDGDQTVELIYYGLALNMNLLDPYFVCDAYGGNNSTYVVDEQGLKLFSGNGKAGNLLKGFNVFSVLRDMQYLHKSTFDGTLKTMEEKGISYSNAILDGEEYYYALYRMQNSKWILLFLVPSSCVATNTVRLVSTTVRFLMAFAVFMMLISGGLIFFILRGQQRLALNAAEKTNAILEVNNQQLAQARATAEAALKKAEAASRAKTDFLANMSHDIRTPMNAIVGITKLMAHDKNDPDKISTYIGKVQQSSEHLLSLINDVLDMSKIESGEVTLNTEQVRLADQLGQVESILRPQIEERQQNFTVCTHNITHENLIGDAVRLRQVFINLLSNAVKYTPNGGSISLELTELPGSDADHARYRIVVADNGYGMSPEFVQHIFEPFTRAENSTTNRVQGTGLGMTITKNIVNLAGGTIGVESEVGKGTRFTVELPLRFDRDAKVELPISLALLISDDESLISNTRAAFRGSGAKLLVAKSEAEADACLAHNPVEVVLLGSRLKDDRLPENIRRLRKKTGDALLIYCCDYNDREQLPALAEQGGIDGVLVRPFFLSGLARAIDHGHTEAFADMEQTSSTLTGKRFLCAEDNALNAEILQALLDMNGASCDIYPDGQKLVEAFADVKPGDYDAILMDVQMPVMNGLDATRAIRRSGNPLGKTVPIIAMTANAFSEDVQNCLNAGMDAHVAKPLDISALERTVKSLTEGKFSGGGRLFASWRHNGGMT